MIINILLAAVYIILFAIIFFKMFYKTLRINVHRFPTYLVLTYQFGFKRGSTKLTVASDEYSPSIRKNFNQFNIVAPLNMDFNDFLHWLRTVKVDEMYSQKNIEGVELMRSLLTSKNTDVLKELNVTASLCNRKALLTSIRQNRYQVKQFFKQFVKPDTSGLAIPKSPRKAN